MGFATRSFKIISLISGLANKKKLLTLWSSMYGVCGIQAPGSHLGRLRPPKRLTGIKCIKMLSPVIANQWDEENDLHFFMIISTKLCGHIWLGRRVEFALHGFAVWHTGNCA